MKQNKILVAFFVLILFSQISFTNTDNLAYAKYPVESWNFDVQSVSISARTIEPGSTIYITPTIRNSGSDTGTVLIYLGIQKPDGSKVYPDQKKIYDTSPGYTKQITLEWDLPSSLQNGAYHVTIDVYNPQKNHMFDTTGFNYSFDVKRTEQFDFGISIDDDYDTVTAGDTARTTIEVYRQSGTSQHVRLSCAGFPSSELGCFLNGNRNQATITPTESVSLSVETGKTTTPKIYSITITGTGGGITTSDTYRVKVNAPAPSPHINPTLSSYSFSPHSINSGDKITGTYTINNPNDYSVDVGLGMSIMKQGGNNEIYNTLEDIVVSVSSGSSAYSRTLTVPSHAESGKYDVSLAIWAGSPGSGNKIDSSGWSSGLAIISPEKIDASIQSISLDSSAYNPSDKVKVNVEFKNTGNIEHLFYIGFSVRDSNGKWHDINPESKYLNPSQMGQTNFIWDVPDSSPSGQYEARISVWENKSGNDMINRLADNIILFTVLAPQSITPESSTSQSVPQKETFDFSMYIDNKYDTITAGDTAKTILKINLESQRSESVSISCSGMPSSQGKCLINDSTTSAIVVPTDSVTISIETGSSTVAKTYSIRITGTSGDITRHEDFVLVVNEKQKEKSPVERPKEQTVTPDLNRDAPIGSVTVEHQAYLLKYRSSAMVQVYGEIENYQKGDPIHVTVKNPRGDSVMDMSLVSKDGTFHMPLMIDWSYTEGTYTVEISSRGNVVGYATFDVVKDSTPKEIIKEIPEIDAEIISFDLNSNSFKYGENVYAYVDVENTGNADHTFYVGFSMQDPSGDWIDVTPQRINLESGETGSVEFDWEIDNDISSGSYDVVTAVWENNDNGLDGRLDDSHYTFHVIDSNKPVVDVKTSPENPDTESRIEFEISVYDDGSEIKNVHLYLDGKIIKSWEKGGKLVYRTDKPLLEGEHMYSVMAQDVSGNVGITEKYFHVNDKPESSFAFYGNVIYQNTFNPEPLDNMKVIIQGIGFVNSTYTNEDGDFKIENIPRRTILGNNVFEVSYVFTDDKYVRLIYDNIQPITVNKKIKIIAPNEGDKNRDRYFLNAEDRTNGIIFHEMRKIAQFYDEHILDDAISTVNVKTNSKKTDSAYYAYYLFGLSNEIVIGEKLRDYNPSCLADAIGMEYTHYVQHQQFGDLHIHPGDKNHHGFKNPSTADSFIEGLGTFMPTVMKSVIDKNHDAEFCGDDIEDNHLVYDKIVIENFDMGEELSIAGILWDLYDDQTVHGSFDENVSISIKEIWDLISTVHELPKYNKDMSKTDSKTYRHVWYLKDLYDILIQYDINHDGIINSTDAELIEKIFNLHGVINGKTDPSRVRI